MLVGRWVIGVTSVRGCSKWPKTRKWPGLRSVFSRHRPATLALVVIFISVNTFKYICACAHVWAATQRWQALFENRKIRLEKKLDSFLAIGQRDWIARLAFWGSLKLSSLVG